MSTNVNFRLAPEVAFDDDALVQALSKRAPEPSYLHRIKKRSIDARSKKVWVNISVDFYSPNEVLPPKVAHFDYKEVSNRRPVAIIGAGPAGLFAALRLIECGLKPVIFERGKDVRQRRRDIAAINKSHIVNPESNYCFGEGGAGTYSDGKLYTRSKKRGDIQRILDILVNHGATENILIDAHPHIGTNKLPQVVQSIRNTILEAGGEIIFNAKVIDLDIDHDKIKGLRLENGTKYPFDHLILATGHSARDVFKLLYDKGVDIEAKPFALGVRVEHPQTLIDQIQYKCPERGPYLPASAYSLAKQANFKGEERGVFSFCMCPGGFIVPAATSPGEIVVNGMSPSRRDSRFANSGIVVAVELEDLRDFDKYGTLAALNFQRCVEQKACEVAGGSQTAPAQRLVDFIEMRTSSNLPTTSYQPGLLATDMNEVLPQMISSRLRVGFKAFGKKMKGYLTNEAQIIGVESRTSSPVKIPRDNNSLEHIRIKGLYPCGEGAGYAGGIVSAAMDGERCANQIALVTSN